MNQIIIGKNTVALNAKIGGGVITGINEVNQLADGAIAVFTSESEMLTAANVATLMLDKKGIFVAVGSGDATKGATFTTTLARFGANYEKKVYIAPVKERKFIGFDGTLGNLNLPISLLAGSEAIIKLTDTTKGLRTIGSVYTNEIKNYNYVVKTGDTELIIATALVAAINNDVNSFVTATLVGSAVPYGIQIDNKEFGQTTSIALDGILISSTIEKDGASNSVAIVYGEGVDNQVLALEDYYSAEQGNTNRIMQPQLWWTKPSMVVKGSTYDMYNMQWTGKNDKASGSQFTVNHQIVVAIPNGATQQAGFETIMTNVFGLQAQIETGL